MLVYAGYLIVLYSAITKSTSFLIPYNLGGGGGVGWGFRGRDEKDQSVWNQCRVKLSTGNSHTCLSFSPATLLIDKTFFLSFRLLIAHFLPYSCISLCSISSIGSGAFYGMFVYMCFIWSSILYVLFQCCVPFCVCFFCYVMVFLFSPLFYSFVVLWSSQFCTSLLVSALTFLSLLCPTQICLALFYCFLLWPVLSSSALTWPVLLFSRQLSCSFLLLILSPAIHSLSYIHSPR